MHPKPLRRHRPLHPRHDVRTRNRPEMGGGVRGRGSGPPRHKRSCVSGEDFCPASASNAFGMALNSAPRGGGQRGCVERRPRPPAPRWAFRRRHRQLHCTPRRAPTGAAAPVPPRAEGDGAFSIPVLSNSVSSVIRAAQSSAAQNPRAEGGGASSSSSTSAGAVLQSVAVTSCGSSCCR